MNFPLSMLWFWSAYLAVNALGMFLGWMIGQLFGRRRRINRRGELVEIPLYRLWQPWRPLLTAAVWTLCARFYFHMARPVNLWVDTVTACIFWTLLSIVADCLLWVVWRHPWSLRPRQMYWHCLPFLLLSYAVSAGAVLLGGLLY